MTTVRMVDIDASVSRQKRFKIAGKTYMVQEPSINLTAEHNKRMFESINLGLDKADEVMDKLIESIVVAIPDLPKDDVKNLPSSMVQKIITEIYDIDAWKDDQKNPQAPGNPKA